MCVGLRFAHLVRGYIRNNQEGFNKLKRKYNRLNGYEDDEDLEILEAEDIAQVLFFFTRFTHPSPCFLLT
jgi:hypothetical protein